MVDFLVGAIGSTAIEWIAAACGLVNVLLLIRRSIWNFPFGFATSSMYFVIFFDNHLYANAFLQIYFLVIQVYGLWYWLRGRAPGGRAAVAPLRQGILLVYLGLTFIAWILIGLAMTRYTFADYPFWDAAVATLSITAQLLLSRRHRESWLFWIAVDVLAIGLFLTRGLTPTALLYGVFLVLAIAGWLEWRRAFQEAASARS